MTVIQKIAQVSVFLVAVGFTSSQAWAQLSEDGPMRPIERLSLLGDEYRAAIRALAEPDASEPDASEPVPFSLSIMAEDIVPPFADSPALMPTTNEASDLQLSFKENMPVETDQESESIDDCCNELTEMISGNLESEISLDAKKQMIKTALKLVARNVALESEAKITKLKADHALEMARMQGQMGQMRSMGNAAAIINRVAGPLSQIMQKNYQQTVAMNRGNQQLSQSLAQLGYQQLEDEAREARENRQRIQLTTQPRRQADNEWRISQLTEQLDRLQQQLQNQQPRTDGNVRPAGYSQPLQPRRKPLEPLPRKQKNEYFDINQYQAQQWQR